MADLDSDGDLDPIHSATADGVRIFEKLHNPGASPPAGGCPFGVSEALRDAIDAGTATLVVAEVGAGHRRCMAVENTGNWLRVDVSSLPSC